MATRLIWPSHYYQQPIWPEQNNAHSQFGWLKNIKNDLLKTYFLS